MNFRLLLLASLPVVLSACGGKKSAEEVAPELTETLPEKVADPANPAPGVAETLPLPEITPQPAVTQDLGFVDPDTTGSLVTEEQKETVVPLPSSVDLPHQPDEHQPISVTTPGSEPTPLD